MIKNGKRKLIYIKEGPIDWKLIETTDLLNTLNKVDGPLLIDSIGGFVMESIDKECSKWSTRCIY